ncbi:putative membrane protein [hydrothermal vent metagenome]|uniref:Putative membrane protein n=1 Tax=hydrothermal vent metagenome TaxID=652676 RepID=A0A3B0ZYE4_9ZZZZ
MDLKRWWVYQRERFPLFANGLLVVAFSFSAVSFSILLRNHLDLSEKIELPGAAVLSVAFFTSLIFFLLLRIADEFKDFEEDSKYRAYRPVPRGLVSLKELGWVGVFIILIQLALALWLDTLLIIPLLITWLYLALMTKEFFVADWLKQSPITYMWSHMLIMPLIDFYATAADWISAGLTSPPHGLFWFLIVSFFNGIVIEVGRKIRAPEDEEEGVETYTIIWGRKRAIAVWLAAMIVTAISASAAALLIDFFNYIIVLLAILIVIAVFLAIRFLQEPNSKRAGWIEKMSGIWTLLMYLNLGVVPLGLIYFNLI